MTDLVRDEDGERLQADNRRLRVLLAMHHGCPISALYGDDGELQCNGCMIDFAREAPAAIEMRWMMDRVRRMQAQSESLPSDRGGAIAPQQPSPYSE